MFFKIAWKSLMNRKLSVALTLASLTVSIIIVVSVEHIRSQARESFNRTVSGVDLIVGARTSQINLLLYSVFRIGNATNSISSESYELIAGDPRVAWTIPLSLGDSHRGFRVVGTNDTFFEHFQYGSQQPLRFEQGNSFSNDFGAVIGAQVATQLQYSVGDTITLSHGVGEISFSNHESTPFQITGILAATGTPIDQALHVPLAGLDAAHGIPHDDHHEHSDEEAHHHISSSEITAFMLGLNSRMSVFEIQRAINDYNAEALSAILPGVALAELWQVMGTVENVLAVISALVMLASLLGIATMLLSSMRERQREIFLFRTVGMHSSTVFLLIEVEALLITALASIAALISVSAMLFFSQSWLSQEFGLTIEASPLSANTALYIGFIFIACSNLSLLPGLAAYRSSLGTQLKY